MNDELIFQADDYDLDGLLRIAETGMADFIFMMQDEESELYYMDRAEIDKYYAQFSKFIMYARDYLEVEETRALFVLFAGAEETGIKLYDGKGAKPRAIPTGEIDLMEGDFYGMLIHCIDGELVFHEALYQRASYKGDAHAEIIHDAGELSDLMHQFILDFN